MRYLMPLEFRKDPSYTRPRFNSTFQRQRRVAEGAQISKDFLVAAILCRNQQMSQNDNGRTLAKLRQPLGGKQNIIASHLTITAVELC
jgi:hypothetical protein